MFLHTILENKILELLRENIRKSLLIKKLNKDKVSNLLKGIVNNRKSSMNFNFPETSPRTPQDQEENYCRDVEQN